MNRKKIKEYWKTKSVEKFYSMANLEQKTVQPYIAKEVGKLNPKKLLDFGCGDGFVHQILNDKIERDLFDINFNELKKTAKRLKNKNCNFIFDKKDIKENHYDVVLLSLVLMCIGNVEEKKKVLKRIKEAMKEDGDLLVVITHPCFRQYEFLPFYTSYTETKEMDYFNNGEIFEVKMKDEEDGIVSFYDFHWNLSHTLNLFINEGFQLTKFNELTDISVDEKKSNELYSPFIIMNFKQTT